MLVTNQFLFLQDVNKLFSYLFQNNYIVTGGELFRTPEQQEIYVKEGKSKTKHSMHLIRCAIDLNIFKDNVWLQKKEDLQVIGDYWESLGQFNKWGGNFPKWYNCTFIDTPHFERTTI